MSQELIYVVKAVKDDASFKEVKDAFDELAKSSKKAEPTSGVDKAIDETTEAYRKQTTVLKELRKELRAKQEEMAQLQAIVKENGGATGVLVDAQRELGASIVSLKSQIREATSGFIDQDSILLKTVNTYNELEQQNRALKLAMRDLPLEDTSGELQKLQQRYEANNTKLKEFDASLGNHQRNVGDYTNSIRAAANAVAIFQGPLGPVAGRINALATTLNRLQVAMGATTKATIALRLAKLALFGVIGLAVTALGALMQWFRRSEEGQERFRVIMAKVSATADVFRERAMALGKAIYEAFQNPQQAVKDLWEAIKLNLMNRMIGIKNSFIALGRVIDRALRFDTDGATEAAKEFGHAFAQAITGVEDVIEKTKDAIGGLKDEIDEKREIMGALQDQMNEVLRTERALNVERAKTNMRLQEARDMVRDNTRSFEERKKALALVRAEEEEMFHNEMNNEVRRLRILQERAAQFTNDARANQELADQEEKIARMRMEHHQRSMSLRRDENAIDRQEGERLLRAARTNMDLRDRLRDLEFAKITEDYERRGLLVEQAQMKLTEFEENRLERERLLIEEFTQEFINQRFPPEEAAQMASSKAKLQIDEEYFELRRELSNKELRREEALLKQDNLLRKLSRENDLNETIAQLEREHDMVGAQRLRMEQIGIDRSQRILDRERDLRAQGIDETIAMERAKQQIELEIARETHEAKVRLMELERQNQEQLMSATVALTKSSLSVMFGDNKAAAVATAIIDTFAAATRALNSPFPFLNTAAVIAAGLANVRKILSTNIGSKGTSANAPQKPNPTEQFRLIDSESNESRLLAGLASPFGSQGEGTTIQLNVIDSEDLAEKVREGNNSLSSRGITVRTN